jgi:streptomycin 6-kinase
MGATPPRPADVRIPPEFARNAVRTWGEQGRHFVDALPERVSAVCREWSLHLDQPYAMRCHWVARVHRPDGSPAVLKLGPLGVPETAAEVTALRHFAGQGAVRLLAHDATRGALLLEQARPGTTVASVGLDIVATAAIITVLRTLHRPPTVDTASLPDLGTRNRRSLLAHLRRHPGDDPVPRRLVTRALGLTRELCADAGQPVVLHGDLHHDNVLWDAAGRRTWLAIDPHGVVGDPLAEVGPMLYNPNPARRDPELTSLLAPRVEQLADGLGVGMDRVVAWGFVQAVLSQVWTAQQPGTPTTRALDVALALEPRLS